MEDNDEIKYFLTSDEQFLINLDKISLITFKSYQGELFKDTNGNTPKKDNNDIYKSSKDILSSYYNVFIDGVSSPLQLKCADGIMLFNILNYQNKILFNSYTGKPKDIGTEQLNGINYTLEEYTIPNKLFSTIRTIPNLNSTTRITIKNDD